MAQVVPWKALLHHIELHYPNMGRPGRQPYALETMLRVKHHAPQVYAQVEALLTAAQGSPEQIASHLQTGLGCV